MKRVVALLLAAIMIAVCGVSFADKQISEFMQTLIELTHTQMKQVKDDYDSKGELTDSQIEMAYSYLKLCCAAEHAKTVEEFYPLSTYIMLKADPTTETEELIDKMWLDMLEGEKSKEDFVKNLMAMIGVFISK